MKAYFDSGASTMVDPKVVEAMLPYFNVKYGNASSVHSFGREAKEAMEDARETIAKSIGAKPEEIVFTSGGTESNNFAIKSAAFSNKPKNHVITTRIDHDCVLNSCKWLEKQGFKANYINVDSEGFVLGEELFEKITESTSIFSAIHGQNEIGTIQDLKELYKICSEKGVIFHTDACQSYTKTELNAKNADMITLNAHKINGPKGVGALYIKKGTKIDAWQSGGGHEFGLRSGTENVSGIVGFAEAVKIGMNPKHREYMEKLRDRMIKGILEIPETNLNGPAGDKRLCNNVNVLFKGAEADSLGSYLDIKGIATSIGSACSSHSKEPSHVLKAIGLTDRDANSSIRITLSRFNTSEEVDYLLEVLPEILKKIRRGSAMNRFADFVSKRN